MSNLAESGNSKSTPSNSNTVEPDFLKVGTHRLSSRLILGSGRYDNFEIMRESLNASQTSCVTVAVRRERLHDGDGRNILDFIDAEKFILLPNTAGCFDAETAVRCARMGREILRGLERETGDRAAVPHHALAVALHVALLKVVGEVLQVMVVGQDGVALRAEEVAVPDPQQRHQHRDVLLQRRGTEMLVGGKRALQQCFEILHAGRHVGEGVGLGAQAGDEDSHDVALSGFPQPDRRFCAHT